MAPTKRQISVAVVAEKTAEMDRAQISRIILETLCASQRHGDLLKVACSEAALNLQHAGYRRSW